MKIIFTGQFKNSLLKGFIDDYGEMKDVGYDILEELLRPYGGQVVTESEGQGGRVDGALSEADYAFIAKVRQFCDDYTFRYARIDFLYWYEYQNRCSDHIQAFLAFLRQFDSNQDILKSEEAQKCFVERLDHLNVIMTSLIDMLNCEKCTACGSFALMDDILEIFEKVLHLKIIGVQQTLAYIIDVIESLFALCASAKYPLKYGYKHEYVKVFIHGVLIPFLGQYLDHARQVSKVTSKKIETQLIEAKVKNLKENGFVEIEIPSMKRYNLVSSYALFSRLLLVYTSDGLHHDEHSTEKFEQELPPQPVFETLIEILTNNYLHKEIKTLSLIVMLKLSQLDMVRRYNYESGKKNPYFMESVKYLYTYIDIFGKLAKYHTETKLLEEPEPEEKNGKTMVAAGGSGDDDFERQLSELEARSIRKYLNTYLTDDKEKQVPSGEDQEMKIIKDAALDADAYIEEEDNKVEQCSPEDDFLRSQEFLSYFIDYMINIAKVRLRQVNQAIFPQILPQIVSIISVKYDMKRYMYPLALLTQSAACKLLKDILRCQQSFDDTAKLNLIIEKLKYEIHIIRVQSQVNCEEAIEQQKRGPHIYPFHAKGKAYLRLFEQSWPKDDDYLCKYQTLTQRQLLIKYLLRLLCFCIKRNDPNLVSYNYNFIAHSRKILESSIIQDDILMNIFKVHETLTIQKDKKSKDQIEETVSPLVLASIQLVTQVFNDLPSKIQTFMYNGLFCGVITSLTYGGFPASPEMLNVLVSFMHLLTLNQDARELLISSQLIPKFFEICLQPEKFHRCVYSGRADERIPELLMSVANCSPIVCNQIFEAFQKISYQILDKSKYLTHDYVAMDTELRKIEDRIRDAETSILQGSDKVKVIRELEAQKNELKTPYELKQLNFENFFGSYVALFSSMFDAERFENQPVSDHVQECMIKYKKELLRVAYLGIQNPVVASALHYHSDEYIYMILVMVSGVQLEDDPRRLFGPDRGNELAAVMIDVTSFLAVQVKNLKLLLKKKVDDDAKATAVLATEDAVMKSSLIEDDEPNQIRAVGETAGWSKAGGTALPGFGSYDDLIPGYCKYLEFFEEETPVKDHEVTKNYSTFINGDNNIVAEDYATIVLRKIYFYAEMLSIWLRMENSMGQYERVAVLFRATKKFGELLMDLQDLSALITKNRGINYSRTVREDQRKLDILFNSVEGLREKVESHNYDRNFWKQRVPATSELILARKLYFKYKKNVGDVSLVKNLDGLQDSADVTNFECDDTICTNAQATQGKIKKLLKLIYQTIRTGRSHHDLALLEEAQYDVCAGLGRSQIDYCLNFIDNGLAFMQWTEQFAQVQDIPFDEMFSKFDNVLFDMISGLSETLKMTGSDKVSGPTIDAFAQRINEVQLFPKLVDLSTQITFFVEKLLQSGIKLQLFRISYVKVLWKDVHTLILSFLDVPFIPPQKSQQNKFLLEIASKKIRDEYQANQATMEILNEKEQRDWEHEWKLHEEKRFKKYFKEIHLYINYALFDAKCYGQDIYMFGFLNKYCQKQFLNLVIKLFDQLQWQVQYPSLQKLWSLATARFDFRYPGMKISESSDLARRQRQLLNNYVRRGLSPTNSQDDPNLPPPNIYGAMRIGSLGNGQYLYVGGPGLQDFQEAIQENPAALGNLVQVDQDKLQSLTDMGFDRDQASNALLKHKNNINDALEQLIYTQGYKGDAPGGSGNATGRRRSADSSINSVVGNQKDWKVTVEAPKRRREANDEDAKNKDSAEANKRKREEYIQKLMKIDMPEERDMDEIYMELKLKVFRQMIESQEDNILYNLYGFEQETQQVYGYQVRLDLIYKQVYQLFTGLACLKESTFEKSQNSPAQKNQLLEIFLNASREVLKLETTDLKQEDLESTCNLKDLVIRLHVFQKLLKHRIYNNLLDLHGQNLSTKSIISINLKILNATVQRLKVIFGYLKDIRYNKINEKAKQLHLGNEVEDVPTPSRTERQILTNTLPLLKSLIQMTQENLSSILVDNLFDLKVNSSLSLMQTVKDMPGEISKATARDILGKIVCIQEFQARVKELFGATLDDPVLLRYTLEQLMQSQISLLKIYNNTPREFVNKKDDLHYPISISLRLLRYIFQIHDYTIGVSTASEARLDKTDGYGGTDGQLSSAGKSCPLRKQFLQSDGLKYVFGIRVIDHFCENVENFTNQKYHEFDQENQLYVGIIEELMAVLAHNRASMIRTMEDQIKQLLFVQFKQKCKRDGQKDFADLLKPLINPVGSKAHQQSGSTQAPGGLIASPKPPESKRQNQRGTQSYKKSGGQNASRGQGTNQGGEHTSQNFQKIYYKYLKMLLKKHDIDNEVPLNPFLDFFLQSNSSSLLPPVQELELFLMACKNTCVINVVDMPESESGKLVTIKLKSNVLRDLILEARAGEESIQVSQGASKVKGAGQGSGQVGATFSWSTEFKRQLPDVYMYHEIIHQLLDIFILQNKGYKMNILKQLKSGKIGSNGPLRAEDPRINFKDGKIVLEVDPVPVPAESLPATNDKDEKKDKKELRVMEMHEYMFDMHSILLVIANEVIKNPVLIGSILKHKDQKTFKYIIRNIVALRHLRILGQDMQIVFYQYSEDELDRRITDFFRAILLDRHPFSVTEKIFRNEARRVFIKEITKNIVEHDQLQAQDDEQTFSTKLLQNYTSFLLLDSLLMTGEKPELRLSDRFKILHKSIRRYNHSYKLYLMIRILYETYLHQANDKANQNTQPSAAVQINFFRQVQRIRDEVQDPARNPLIMYKPIALSKTIEVVLQIINQFASQSELLTQMIQSSSKRKPAMPTVKDAAVQEIQDSSKPSSPPSKPSSGKPAGQGGSLALYPSGVQQADNDQNDQPKRTVVVDPYNKDKSDAQITAAPQLPKDDKDQTEKDEDANVDDVSFTLEDRREIEQLRKEEARSQMENVIARYREADGVEGIDGDEEGEDADEDDVDDDDEDFSDSYELGDEELGEEGEHDISGAIGGGSRGLVDRRSRSLSSQGEELEVGLYGSDDFVSSGEYDSDDDLDDLDEEGAEEDEYMEDEMAQSDLIQYLQGLNELRNEYEESLLNDQRQQAGVYGDNLSDREGNQEDFEDEYINVDDFALGGLDDSIIDDEEAEVTDGTESDDIDSYGDEAGNEFDDEDEEHGGAGGQAAEAAQGVDFGEHGDGYVHYMRRADSFDSRYEDMSESSFDHGYDNVRNNYYNFEDQLKIYFISAKPHMLPSIMHAEYNNLELIELYQGQQEYQQESGLGTYCQAIHRPTLRRDVLEGDWNSGLQARKHMIEAMKSIMEKLCTQLSGQDGIATTVAKDVDYLSSLDDNQQSSSWAQIASKTAKRMADRPNYEAFILEHCQSTTAIMNSIMTADKEKLKGRVSLDDWMVLYINFVRLIKGLRDLVDFELRMDINLYASNMIIINQTYARAGPGQGALNANLKSSLADLVGGQDDVSNHANRSLDAQSALMNPQSANNMADQSMDNNIENQNNQLVSLEGTQSYEEFKRALRIVAGEEAPSPGYAQQYNNLQQQYQQAPKPVEENQIDSSAPRAPQKGGNDVFDQIDPLFTEALDAPSIQAIKEGDYLIKKIQHQSSLPNTNKPYVQTINDFLKSYNQSLRQTLLKGLGYHVLAHLSPDLFMEARRLRPPQNVQQRAAAGAGDQAQHQRGRAPANRHGRQYQVPPYQAPPQQLPEMAVSSLYGQTRQTLQGRDRLQSVESDLLQIGEHKNKTNRVRTALGGMHSYLRDSESEDFNTPFQRLNLTHEAFNLALHNFLQETRDQFDQLLIRDQIRQDPKNLNSSNPWRRKEQSNNAATKLTATVPSTHILTNSDLRDYCEHLVIEQFKDQEIAIDLKHYEGGPAETTIRSNAKQIVSLLDIAITEVKLLNKGTHQLDQGYLLDPSKSKRLSTIIQVPNFRMGMIVKLIKMMNNEIAQLMSYIEKYKALTAGNANYPFLTKRALSYKLPAYKGCTKVWESRLDTYAKILTPKRCLTFFLKSIYEIQNVLFDKKIRATTNGLLDLLKSPSTDPHLRLLYQELGILNSFKMLDKAPEAVIDMTLLDQILQMIADCILLTTGHPDAFDFSESQEKELNKWKQDTLQNLCRILQYIDVSLNIVGRKLKGRVPAKQDFRFTLSTLNKLFNILFFADPANGANRGSQVLDNSQRSIAIVSKVLNRISVMPLYIPSGGQDSEASAQIPDHKINLLRLYQKYQEAQKDNDVIMDVAERDKSTGKSSLNIVTMKIVQILNVCMQSFYEFFNQRFYKVEMATRGGAGAPRSVLSITTKREKSELTKLIEKILHVFKISLNLAQGRGNPDHDVASHEYYTMKMLQEEQQLTKLLQVVQMVIDNEEAAERMQTTDGKREDNIYSRAYLYKEEFKLILYLVFTLSYHDLKHSKITTVSSKPEESKQEEAAQPGGQGEQEQPREAEIDNGLPNIPYADGGGGRGARGQSRRQARRDQQPPPVSFQSAEEIRRQYDPASLKLVPAAASSSDLEQILSKFKPGRTQDLVKFFYNNKRLLNQYIKLNQSAATVDHFLNFVIYLPQILDFESKRLLWRLCIKKHLRKTNRENGEYEIDIQIRRNQVFADSFEQLKDIQLESWKQKFTVEFHDEEGVDEGGLLKEWFELISKGIFDPNYALFYYSAQGSTYYPNPNADVHDEYGEMVSMFRFVGRIMGKALNEGQLLDCYLVKALYKMMLGQTLELSDLQDFDEQVYRSLIYMLENDAEILCQTFILSSKYFDEDKDVELIPGGREVDVTNANKFEYCQKVLEHRLYKSIKTQIEAFLQGFRDLVPATLIQIFDYKELELMLSGLPTIDIEDLKENVIYKNYSKSSSVILWLWEVLEELKNSERAEFIQFVTASSKVPIEGFKGLRGSNGQVQKVEIIKLNTDCPDKRLPYAHTCFFQLDLPEYSSKEILREKLLIAIQEGKTFNIA